MSVDADDEPDEPTEPSPFLLALAAVIRTRRKRLGMTQSALGLEVGQSQRRVYEWEHGSRDLRLSGSLVPLAAALQMSVTALIAAVEVELADASG